jgi:hypothetical protein
MRYVPYDEAGYLNYFKDNNLNGGFNAFIVLSLFMIFICIFSLIYILDYRQVIIAFCFMFSITLLLNLMNIVLSFRTNTTPILKTKELRWSLKNSLENIKKRYDALIDKPFTVEYNIIVGLLKSLNDGNEYNNMKERNNVSSIINILKAFHELMKIQEKYVIDSNKDNEVIIDNLKRKISSNYEDFKQINSSNSPKNKKSDLSLIFDKQVVLPTNYNEDEHKNNDNTNNSDYEYTADISYGNANLFYEKYWNIKEFGCFELVPSFLKDYSYFSPIFYNYMMSPNLLSIWGLIIGIIFIMLLIPIIFKMMDLDMADDISFVISTETLQFLYENLLPLITFSILIIYIISFISFNTTFNKYVVYKCLDCSYKRSLNKLNNIVTPYIRLYDNKKKTGNKNYLHQYIIANVFYSLLNGDIKLTNDSANNAIIDRNMRYDLIKTARRDLKKQIIDEKFDTTYDTYDKYKVKFPNNVKRDGYFKYILSLCDAIKTKITYAKNKYATGSSSYTKLGTIENEIKKITGAPADGAVGAVEGALPTIIKRTVEETATTYATLFPLIIQINTNAKTAYQSLITTESEEKKLLDIDNKATATPPISSSEQDYSSTLDIKSKNYKFANMNNNMLSNDNVFREYYKEKFKNIYKSYDSANTPKIYDDLPKIFKDDVSAAISNNTNLKDYLEKNIFDSKPETVSNLENIYNIIQRCFELFDENQFNNNLIYYNNPKSKKDGIDIDVYNKFYFNNKNKGDKIIPYQFKLKLDSLYDVQQFCSGLENKFKKDSTMTMEVLLKFDDDPYTSIDPIKNNENLQKIIAKFLLILCHINYNKYSYSLATTTSSPTKKEIYERKTQYLYKLFSDTSYNDIYEIDDTFNISDPKTISKEYKELTYIYNYLETKYVYVSSNNNNNYLMNIIKSINKKINDDDKIFNDDSKDAQYIFSNYISKSNNFDNEDEILNIANNISTTSFGITYITNMILLLAYYYFVLKK